VDFACDFVTVAVKEGSTGVSKVGDQVMMRIDLVWIEMMNIHLD
jgi:hypothetical protein